MRPEAFPSVGTKLHQDAYHFRVAIEDRKVQRDHLAEIAAPIDAYQFGPRLGQLADRGGIPSSTTAPSTRPTASTRSGNRH
jgi:hypothetical protein